MTKCIIWSGAKVNGYPVRDNGRGKTHRYLHREAWEKLHGPIPKGMCICHSCDNRACINPEHLWLGTIGDNVRDAVAKKRHVHGVTHPSVKLTEAQVLEIREWLKAPYPKVSQKAKAKEYGVGENVIGDIKFNRTWRHL